jgi:hypothetical protein
MNEFMDFIRSARAFRPMGRGGERSVSAAQVARRAAEEKAKDERRKSLLLLEELLKEGGESKARKALLLEQVRLRIEERLWAPASHNGHAPHSLASEAWTPKSGPSCGAPSRAG